MMYKYNISYKDKFRVFMMVMAIGISMMGSMLTSLAAEPSVWIQNSADRAFDSDVMPRDPETSIKLYTARNEYEAAQILTRSSQALTNVHITYSDLIGPSGQKITKDNITVRREYSHTNVKQYGVQEYPEDEGNSYTDALVENTPQSIQANKTLAYWYSVYVPIDQQEGTYTGTAVVNSHQGTRSINISVEVYDVTLAATTSSTIKMNNWFGSAGWDYAGTEKSITTQYNCEKYDDNWWKVMKNIAKNHKKHRNNVIYADFTALLIPNTSIDENGGYHFGWETFDRFIQLFIDEGACQYIYTPHLLETSQGKLEMIKKGANGNIIKALVQANTPETNQYMDKLIPALKSHLDQKGWTDMFYIAANDEPGSAQQANAANWFYDKVAQHFPNVKSCEAHNGQYQTARVEDKLTDVAPMLNVYEQNRAYYERLSNEGKDIWLYTCIAPRGEYLNRFVSYHLSRTRLLPWYVMKINGAGYLHWGWNYWSNTPDTFDLSPSSGSYAGGDSWLVYPDKKNYDIYDSVRSEAQLDGVEDYELLQLLKTKDKDAANSIIESIISTGTRYTTSGEKITHAHKKILDLLTGKTPSAQPSNIPSQYQELQRINATASTTVADSWSPSKAIDGLKNTGNDWGSNGWSSNKQSSEVGQEDITIELDRNSLINEVRLIPRTWNDSVYCFPRNFKIQYSVDGVNYMDIQGQSYENYINPANNNGENFVFAIPVTGKYIKIVGTKFRKDTGGSYFMQLTEVEVYGSKASSTNLAKGKTVTASSSAENWGWLKSSVVDGEVNSLLGKMGWTSWNQRDKEYHEEWIKIDLGESKSISGIELFPRNDGDNTGKCFPVNFSIQSSEDDNQWQTVINKEDYPQVTQGQLFNINSTQARYIKVVGSRLRKSNQNMYLMQFAEIKAIGE